MKRTTILMIVLALAVSCTVGGIVVISRRPKARAAAETAPAPPATADNTVAESLTSSEAYGLPGKLSSLRDLNLIYEREDLSRPQRVDILVWWLAQERANPTPTHKGSGGGRIDSGYIQAQLVKMLREVGDPRAMTELVESEAISDERVRDGLICALGMMGDASRIPRLLEILGTHEDGDFRALAATALGYVGAVEAREALNRALTDEFATLAGSDVGPVRLWVAYPVREGAEAGLRMLNSEQAMAKAQQRREAFAESMNRGPAEGTPSDGN